MKVKLLCIRCTTLPSIAIGKSVAAVIRNPQLTQNKRIYIADATLTQKQALDLFEKYTKTKWTVKNVVAANVRKEAEENLAKGNIPQAVPGYILSTFYSGSSAANFEGKTINKSLGVPTFPLDQIIKEAVARQKNSQ